MHNDCKLCLHEAGSRSTLFLPSFEAAEDFYHKARQYDNHVDVSFNPSLKAIILVPRTVGPLLVIRTNNSRKITVPANTADKLRSFLGKTTNLLSCSFVVQNGAMIVTVDPNGHEIPMSAVAKSKAAVPEAPPLVTNRPASSIAPTVDKAFRPPGLAKRSDEPLGPVELWLKQTAEKEGWTGLAKALFSQELLKVLSQKTGI